MIPQGYTHLLPLLNLLRTPPNKRLKPTPQPRNTRKNTKRPGNRPKETQRRHPFLQQIQRKMRLPGLQHLKRPTERDVPHHVETVEMEPVRRADGLAGESGYLVLQGARVPHDSVFVGAEG